MGEPLEFCRTRLPQLFAQTLDALQQEVSAEPIGTRVRFGGDAGGEVCWVVAERALRIVERDALPSFGYALDVPAQAAVYAIERFERGGFSAGEVGGMLTLLATDSARDAFAESTYRFELTVRRVPVLGELRMRVALGGYDIEAPPEFTLAAEFDDLADAREQQVAPHRLFMAGKLEMDGDVAKAMMLGMALAQI